MFTTVEIRSGPRNISPIHDVFQNGCMLRVVPSYK